MISFIIPAHNEERVLGETLRALDAAAKSLGERFEIIVVSDASTDRTEAIARENGARVIAAQNRQIAATRNAGAKAANGDLFLFVDADTMVTTEVLREARSLLANGAAGGGARVQFEAGMPLWVRGVAWLFSALYFSLNLGAGCFFFVRKDIFKKVGGFDEQYFAAEETYLSLAIKKVGKFRLTRAKVITSGRKFRIYSTRKMLAQSLQVLWRGRRAILQRETLDIWYDGGRER